MYRISCTKSDASAIFSPLAFGKKNGWCLHFGRFRRSQHTFSILFPTRLGWDFGGLHQHRRGRSRRSLDRFSRLAGLTTGWSNPSKASPKFGNAGTIPWRYWGKLRDNSLLMFVALLLVELCYNVKYVSTGQTKLRFIIPRVRGCTWYIDVHCPCFLNNVMKGCVSFHSRT